MTEHAGTRISVPDVRTGLSETWSTLMSLDWLSRWTTPTPLPGWSVGDIACHIVHVEETYVHGPPPAGEREGDLHERTERGVASLRSVQPDEVVARLHDAGRATLDLWASEPDWDEVVPTIVGDQPRLAAMDTRLADLYVHVLDVAAAAGLDLESVRSEGAERAITARLVRLSGWAAVKRAVLPDGAAIRLVITEPDRRELDVVVAAGRGEVREPAAPAPQDRITGPGIALALVAGGRAHPAQIVDGLVVEGPQAAAFLARFRLFG